MSTQPFEFKDQNPLESINPEQLSQDTERQRDLGTILLAEAGFLTAIAYEVSQQEMRIASVLGAAMLGFSAYILSTLRRDS